MKRAKVPKLLSSWIFPQVRRFVYNTHARPSSIPQGPRGPEDRQDPLISDLGKYRKDNDGRTGAATSG